MKLRLNKVKSNRIIAMFIVFMLVTVAIAPVDASAHSIVMAAVENPYIKIKTYFGVIKNIFLGGITLLGVCAAARGIFELGSSISARDFGNGAKTSIAEAIGGIISAAAGVAGLYFTF